MTLVSCRYSKRWREDPDKQVTWSGSTNREPPAMLSYLKSSNRLGQIWHALPSCSHTTPFWISKKTWGWGHELKMKHIRVILLTCAAFRFCDLGNDKSSPSSTGMSFHRFRTNKAFRQNEAAGVYLGTNWFCMTCCSDCKHMVFSLWVLARDILSLLW